MVESRRSYASASAKFASTVVGVAVALGVGAAGAVFGACERRQTGGPADGGLATPIARAGLAGDNVSRRERSAPGFGAIRLPALGRVVSAKTLGHTSLVLKLAMDNGSVVAFKPSSILAGGAIRYRGEIAAYRLAQALGIYRVPEAEPRAFPTEALRVALVSADERSLFTRQVADEGGMTRGAAIAWIRHYEEIPLERAPLRDLWTEWLTGDLSPTGQADVELAAAISTMLVFDYVSGNWDRMSGGNTVRDGDTGVLLFVDNDGAFFEHAPESAMRSQLALVQRLLRFSRAFVGALRALDTGRLQAALGEERPGHALISTLAQAGVLARKDQALRAIDNRIVERGEAATLPFL